MPGDSSRIACERIRILFKLAEKTYQEDPQRAQRYASLARKIASRNRVHLPPEYRRRICRKCKVYMTPSSSRTRIRQAREPHVAVTCLACGHVNRHMLRRKKP